MSGEFQFVLGFSFHTVPFPRSLHSFRLITFNVHYICTWIPFVQVGETQVLILSFYSLACFHTCIHLGIFTEVCEWQQVSSALQDSSVYSRRSQLYCFVWCQFFLLLPISPASFGNVLSTPTTNGVTVTFMFHSFFSPQNFFYLFTFLRFHSVVPWNGIIHHMKNYLFLVS